MCALFKKNKLGANILYINAKIFFLRQVLENICIATKKYFSTECRGTQLNSIRNINLWKLT